TLQFYFILFYFFCLLDKKKKKKNSLHQTCHQKKHKKFRLHNRKIDFGTEGTAMAINMKNSTSVHSITDWSSNGTIDMKESTGKTKTALLLDKDYQVIAFGNEAWNKFYFTHFKKITY
ncbi:hypothetical protein RFI_02950, partial [Reticulomyxa filosa]